jgi:radical SAM superfamily enzyme YgiQ (UPF0313 family)
VLFFDFMMESNKETEEGGALSRFEREIREFHPSFIGLSIRNVDNVNTLEQETFLDIPKLIVETVRKTLPDVPVLLGGSGYSIMPAEILEAVGADYGVAGEGEQAVVEFAEALKKGELPREKITIRTRPNFKTPLQGDAILGAEYLPRLVDFYNKAGCVMPVQTKRGCSNHCVYCTYPILEGRELRCRPPEDVVADMLNLRDNLGADMVFFTDSVFNDSRGKYLEIVDAMERERVNIPWTAFFQPDPGLTERLVERLAATGLQSVELGPDATTDDTLKSIGKSFSFEDVVRCNKLFAEKNIAVANYFMMGVPGETKETVEEGVENIKSLDMSVSFVFLGVRILPGTPLFHIAVKEKVISGDASMLEPVYYFPPDLDKKWLEDFLGETLAKIKHCVYPPNSMDSGIRILRQMGYRGNLWEMMVKNSRRLPKRSRS